MRAMLMTAAFVLTAATMGAAQTAGQAASPGIEVSEAVLATGVEIREPVGVATSFPADVGTVYFYTVFEGEFDELTLHHVWLRGEEEVARVPLRVRGPRWRTWSSKRIPPEWSGRWTVQVMAADGQVLWSVDFTVGT